jgi:hypothetical protein
MIHDNGSIERKKRASNTSPVETAINGGGINVDSGSCNVSNCFIFQNYAIEAKPLSDDKKEMQNTFIDTPKNLPASDTEEVFL